MCKELQCSCLDAVLCSLFAKVVLFALWALVNGLILFFIFVSLSIFEDNEKSMKFMHIITALFCALHIISAAFQLFGIFKEEAGVYFSGFLLSWMLPVILYRFVYLLRCLSNATQTRPYIVNCLAVQILFSFFSYRFFYVELKEA